MHVQALITQIWSEQDLSSLHTLEVREDDFQTLKLEQGILVDFGGFPAKIITLLQRCLASSHEDPPRCDTLQCDSECSAVCHASAAGWRMRTKLQKSIVLEACPASDRRTTVQDDVVSRE